MDETQLFDGNHYRDLLFSDDLHYSRAEKTAETWVKQPESLN
jgi:hypothetical protein